MVSSEIHLSGEEASPSKSSFTRRVTAGVSLVTFVLTSGLVASAPSPRLWLPNRGILVGLFVALCLTIARTYFVDFESDDRTGTLIKLVEAGILGTLAGHGAAELLERLTPEVVEFYLGDVLTSATITPSVIAVIGFLFWLACDSAWRKGTSISRGLVAVIGRLFVPPEGSGSWSGYI